MSLGEYDEEYVVGDGVKWMHHELTHKRTMLSQRLFCLSFGHGTQSSPSGVTRPREFLCIFPGIFRKSSVEIPRRQECDLCTVSTRHTIRPRITRFLATKKTERALLASQKPRILNPDNPNGAGLQFAT